MENLIPLRLFKQPRESSIINVDQISHVRVVSMFESHAYKMTQLRKEMLTPKAKGRFPCVRKFTQMFCKITRETSGLSQEELCLRLNQHLKIKKMACLPGARSFFPIKPELIARLEMNISEIMEYQPYGGGFLGIGSLGIPTMDLAEAIAEVCDMRSDFIRYQGWCLQYSS